MQSRNIVRIWFYSASLAFIASAVGAGCGDDDDAGGTAGTGGTAGIDMTAGMAGTTAGTSAGNLIAGSGGTQSVFVAGSGGLGGSGGVGGTGTFTGAAFGEAMTLADGEIAAVLMAADMGEIQHGQLALERASNDDVRAFAEQMIEEHGDADAMLSATLDEQMITATPNALSDQVTNQATQALDALEGRSDETFDLAYMESQAAMHTQVLNAIEQELLPQVLDAALRADVETMRQMEADHLARAEELSHQLTEGD